MSQKHHNPPRLSEGVMLPKTDEKGRIYREVRCMHCRAFIIDEYIIEGRVRYKCFKCGRIMIMEFRPRRSKRKPGAPGNIKTKEDVANE